MLPNQSHLTDGLPKQMHIRCKIIKRCLSSCAFHIETKWKNFRSWIEALLLGPSKIKPRELYLHFCATNQQFEYIKVPCPETRLTFIWSRALRQTHRGPRALIHETVGDSLWAQLCHNEHLSHKTRWQRVSKRQRIHISCILSSLNYKAAAIYTKRDASKGKNSEDSL